MSDLTDRLQEAAQWCLIEGNGDDEIRQCLIAAADELDRLTASLFRANNNHEHFEREWYLRGDELDRLRVTNKMMQDDKAALMAERDQAMKERARAITVGSDMEQEVERLREQLTLAESVRSAQVAGLERGILEALPLGSVYMDPPDGGDVGLVEQLGRMAKDAARYRWLRDCAGRVDWAEHNPTRSGIMQVVSHCRIGPQGMDAAIDAALKGGA
jgi:hypothetical protein